VIVREEGGEVWLFDQRDHSVLCGRMAEQWGAPPFEPVGAEVRTAAGGHDGGWPEWDALPRLDPRTGLPHPYSDMPAADYREIWERGLRRGWREGDVAGLLVSLHAMRFFARRKGSEDRALLARERERQADVLERLGVSVPDPLALPDPIARLHAWMFFWDGLSLFLCERWRSPWEPVVPDATGREVTLRVERGTAEGPGGLVEIDPFPFREDLGLEVTARVIPARRNRSQAELDRAVATARRERVTWKVRRAS
jgi:hypothetical protein